MQTISVVIFSPPTDFMSLDLSQKIATLLEQIQTAYRIVKKTNPNAHLVFLCPTFTLSNANDRSNHSHTEDQLRAAQNELQLYCQSLGHDLIVLPGTTGITKPVTLQSATSAGKTKLFGSPGITVHARHKQTLDLINGDTLQKVLEKNGLFEHDGIRFGIEINQDHQNGMLKRLTVIYQAAIDVQIVFANENTMLSREKLAKQKNLIVIYARSHSGEVDVIRYDVNGSANRLAPIELKANLAIYPNICIPQDKPVLRAKL